MTATTDFVLFIALTLATFLCLFVQQSRHEALERRVAMMEALHSQENKETHA